MKRLLALVLPVCLVLMGCERYEPISYNVNKSAELRAYESELAEEAAQAALGDTGEAAAFADGRMAAGQGAAAEQAGTDGRDDSAANEEQTAESRALAALRADDPRKAVKVKGIYLTARTAGSDAMEEIIARLDETELNAVVIDVKDDEGRVTWDTGTPTVKALGAVSASIRDLPGLIARLHEHGVYVIARCVAFRDPWAAEARPEWCLRRADGSVFRDSQNMAWVNPYSREVWEYLLEIGTACAQAGFDEIQFDYLRFCTESGMDEVAYDEAETGGLSRMEIVAAFAQYAAERLATQGVYVSADVFGSVIGSYVDAERVGQDYGALAAAMDYVCPMIYPSHYADGNFGLAHPDLEPYKAVSGALALSRRELEAAGAEDAHQAVVRPWLQGFTASYLEEHLEYGAEEVRAQIDAVYDSGYEEWIVWNASNRYDWEAFERAA